MNKDIIKQLSISNFTKYFSQFISKHEVYNKNIMTITAILLSHVLQEGKVCIEINDYAEKKYSDIWSSFEEEKKLPNEKDWINAIQKSNLVSVDVLLSDGLRLSDSKTLTNSTGSINIFKFINNRIYLYKYWMYENNIINFILENNKIQKNNDVINQNIFNEVFHESEQEKKDAAKIIIENQFSILSGGPGTGKTYTMVNILFYLIKKYIQQKKKIKIVLAAPTGKAAARMEESIQKRLEEINISKEEKELLPSNALTLHRLLGYKKNSSKIKYNFNNQLPYDIIIIDEASMIDIIMMNNIVSAISHRTKLILLGDKDQLSSVEAGKVFGELSTINREEIPVAVLTKSRRFDDKSGIGKLIKSIKFGEIDNAFKTMNTSADIKWISKFNSDNVISQIIEEINKSKEYNNLVKEKNPEKLLSYSNHFSVLCATRKGLLGIENLNIEIQNYLSKIDTNYNKMIMIKKNDYQNNLYNGDILLSLDENIYLNKNQSNEINKTAKILLPAHEDAFAITIHKSQGSEYDTVLCVFPDDSNIKILSRELLYTAVSRAKTKLIIVANEKVISTMILNPIKRKSGLSESLIKLTTTHK